MKVLNFQQYRDGGTTMIETDQGTFAFDRRLQTKTEGFIFEGYPKEDNSNIIKNSGELEKEIIEALKNYEDIEGFYQESIKFFLEERQQ
jgi:hypothetical protein